MAMKQTQTKMFDFSDTGLDFCSGSKNLFPDRFKKMLALGYNVQTVSSVAVAGSQVTLTYGVSHGYVADRVLKVDSGALASINGGEFWIDSVTINTVTMTINNAPLSVSGGFTTKIASLGYDLVYEQANIHVYRFKAIDESDLYLRLCFQNNQTYRNSIAPCIGNSFNPTTGNITDSVALTETASILSPNIFAWEFSYLASNTFNNYTYSQGIGTFGKAMVVGSKYHLIFNHYIYVDSRYARVLGFTPCLTVSESLQKVVIIGESKGGQSSNASVPAYLTQTNDLAYCGKYAIVLTPSAASIDFDTHKQAASSIYSNIYEFNATSAEPIFFYHRANGQLLGSMLGMYRLKYAAENSPTLGLNNLPLITKDIDLDNNVLVHYLSRNSEVEGNQVFYALPIEEIKIA